MRRCNCQEQAGLDTPRVSSVHRHRGDEGSEEGGYGQRYPGAGIGCLGAGPVGLPAVAIDCETSTVPSGKK
jgi:hypothetical protein